MREAFEILDPTGGEEAPQWTLRTPMDPQRRGRVGLLDISKPQGDLYLDEVEKLLCARGFSVSRYRKPTMTRPATAELVREIAASCDAAVVALAD
jgi:hypothetical protein